MSRGLSIHFDNLSLALGLLDLGELGRLRDLIAGAQGTVWICGNGGSAATALHWALDLSKAAPVRAQTLGANMPLLTAWANDNGYANVFSEELLRVARTGDILVCLSCSGTSPNILAVLHQAWKLQMPRVLLTGQSYLEVTPVDIVIQVQSGEYGVIEDVHSAIGHWLTKEIGP